MSDVRTLDVSALPPGAFGSQNPDVLGHAGDRRHREHRLRPGHRRVLLPRHAISGVAARRRRGA